jgi:hypothetical protein
VPIALARPTAVEVSFDALRTSIALLLPAAVLMTSTHPPLGAAQSNESPQ